MQLIIEENCSVPSKDELDYVTPTLKKYIDSIVDTFHIDTLDYFVIADSDQSNFTATVKKYAALIGTDTNITDNDGYQTAAKSIDGVDCEGIYHQVIIIKGMMWTSMLYDLLRLTCELPQELVEQTDSIKYLSLTAIVHELGHAVDNLYQFRHEGYCDEQIAFNLSAPDEYEKYVYRSTLSLWGEYFAESFCYEIIKQELPCSSDELTVECIKTYSRGGLRNQIVERVHMILYYFVHRLGCLHRNGKDFNYSTLENDAESSMYMPYLQEVEASLIELYATLPEWNNVAYEQLTSIYHKLIQFERNKYKY